MTIRRITCLVAGFALGAVTWRPDDVHAQVAGAASCSPAVVYNENPSPNSAGPIERMHPLISRARYADAVRLEQWEQVLGGLREESAAALTAAAVQGPALQLFLSELDAIIAALPGIPPKNDPARAGYLTTRVVLSRFTPGAGIASFALFDRLPNSIDVGALPDSQQQALCWSALSIDQVLSRLGAGLDAATLARLGRLNTAWSNYRTYGYTRQPLELFVFRRSSTVHDTLPQQTQFLLGHLSLGGDVRWKDSLTSVSAAVIELFGLLRYRSNYTQYSGVSAIVSVPSGRRPGAGLMVHVARGLRGGVLLRKEEGDWRTDAVMSTDLYGMLERSKRSVEQGLAFARGRTLLSNKEEKK
jgi:hypothetical protein